jgi:hypothetical protein
MNTPGLWRLPRLAENLNLSSKTPSLQPMPTERLSFALMVQVSHRCHFNPPLNLPWNGIIQAINSTMTCVLHAKFWIFSLLRLVIQNSNVVKFFSMLKKDDRTQQLVYYQVCNLKWIYCISLFGYSLLIPPQAGIGTYTIPQIAKPAMAKLKKTLDSMICVHLDAHVMGELFISKHAQDKFWTGYIHQY